MGSSFVRVLGAQGDDSPLVSIIAPVYNEAEVLEEFVRRLVAAVAPLGHRYRFEFVLVDDGSCDQSLCVMRGLLSCERRLRVVELRRNYGQTAALQAGLDAATGSIFITMDADLQHFPEEIPYFLETLDQGHDLVCGWRHQRQEGAVRRWPSRMANALIRRISRLGLHDFGTTFRAYRADLARQLRLFGESHRYLPVLAYMHGANIAELPIRNIERPKGKSNYGLGRTFGVFLDLILLYFLIRYLDRPLRAFGKIAVSTFAAGVSILTFLVVYSYLAGLPMAREHSGWLLVSVMLILAALQIILVGLLGEILIRIHFAQGDRRVYAVRREWNSAQFPEAA
jgi:glycosyltransferase involved in cell wall biosynthesis